MIKLVINEPVGGLTDQTGRIWADGGTTGFSLQLGQRGTATIYLFVGIGDTYQPIIGSPIYIYEQDDDPDLTLFDDAPGMFDDAPGVFDAYGGAAAVCVYAGTIDTLATKWHGSDGLREIALGCVSLEQTLDGIMVSKAYYSEALIPDNWTCGRIVADLLNYFGAGLPIGSGVIQDGATVPSVVFDQVLFSDCLNQLAQTAGFIWYIDPQDQLLYFCLPGGAPAPWTLTDISGLHSGDGALFETLELDQTRQDYRNRQIVRFASAASQNSVAFFGPPGGGLLGPELDLFWTPLAIAEAVLSTDTLATVEADFTGLPLDGETITVNSGRAYTWKSAIDNVVEDQILIGGTASECAQNLADAIDAEPSHAGIGFSLPTQENADLTAWWHGSPSIGVLPLAGAVSLVVTLYAKTKGAAGNGQFVSSTSTAYSFTNLGVLTGATGTGSGDTKLTPVQGDASTSAATGDMVWTLGFVQVTIPAALTGGNCLYVTFRRLGADCISVENSADVAARAAIEHGTGKYQMLISDTANGSYPAAFAEAFSWLDGYDTIPDSFQLETDSPFLTPGMTLTVAMTKPTGASVLNGTWLVREVDGTLIPGYASEATGHFRYTVTLINQTKIVNYISFWTALASGSGTTIAAGGAGSSGGGSGSRPALLSGTESVVAGAMDIVQHGGAGYNATTAQAPGPNAMIVILAAPANGDTLTGVNTLTDNVGTIYSDIVGPWSLNQSPTVVFLGYPSSTSPITFTGQIGGVGAGSVALAYIEVKGLQTDFPLQTYAFNIDLSTTGPVLIICGHCDGTIFATATPAGGLIALDECVSGHIALLHTAYQMVPVTTVSGVYGFSVSGDSWATTAILAFQPPSGPSFNPGQDGDFYMDLTRNRLYGPRAGGNWPTKGWPLGIPS